jgi:hypothetical protein
MATDIMKWRYDVAIIDHGWRNIGTAISRMTRKKQDTAQRIALSQQAEFFGYHLGTPVACGGRSPFLKPSVRALDVKSYPAVSASSAESMFQRMPVSNRW